VAWNDPVPGIANAAFQFGATPQFSQDQSGQIVFVPQLANVTASNDTGVWKFASGTISKILREGDAAPQTESGVTFGNIAQQAGPFPRIVNGKVAVLTNLTGPTVTAANNTGIWLGDGTTLNKVVREGDDAPGGGQFLEVGLGGTNPGGLAMTGSGAVVFSGKLSSGPSG